MKNSLVVGRLLPSALVVAFAAAWPAPVTTQTPVQRDFTRELANKMRGTYVVAATGSVLMQDALGRQASLALQRVLRDANTAIGSLETYQLDTPAGSLTPATPSDVAHDLADLGFDMLGAGESSGGDVALRSGIEALSSLRLPTARADRQPVFQSLANGRASLVMAPNPLRLSTTKYVTAAQLAQLKAIRDSIVAHRNDPDVARPIGVPADLPDQVTLFSDTFVVGPVAGEIREEVNAADRQANLAAVRAAKEFADFVAFSMPMPPTQKPVHQVTTRKPHESVVAQAHELVDNGMDMYVGAGNHVVQGVEIYKGRPIFYNLGDWSVHRGTSTPESLVAVLATTTYQDGILQEVRLYPVDLGVNPTNRPASTLGIAMTPSADLANQILAELQKNSDAFGTKIAIENGVGVIRVPRDATVAIGQGVRDFGAIPRGGAAAGGGRGGRGGGRGGF